MSDPEFVRVAFEVEYIVPRDQAWIDVATSIVKHEVSHFEKYGMVKSAIHVEEAPNASWADVDSTLKETMVWPKEE
jgi:hypothetical protein